MPLLANVVRHPIRTAACAVAVVVLAQVNLATAAPAAPVGAAGLRAAVGGTTYLDTVAQDNPTNLWRLDDTTAGTALDSAGTDNLTVDGSATRGAGGPMLNESSVATSFSGAGTVPATTSRSIAGPQSFSVEAWFKTTSTSGGKIIGFGSSRTGNSNDYDRHLYLTNDGRLTFGVYPTTYRYLTSASSYNDGQWHQVVGSHGPTGMDLFVDGRLVAQDTSTAGAELFSGYWRIGGDNVTNWPSVPAKFSFTGTLADVAVYSSRLSLARVKAHYAASGRTAEPAGNPTDAYGAAVVGDNPAIYWRLNESSGLSAKDQISGDTKSATYSSGTVLGEPGSSAAPAGKSIRFPGTSAQTVSSTVQFGNPTVYSLETWFKTTTTSGGRLIGFGSSRTGNSTAYDRQIYMLDSGQLRYGIYSGQTMAIDSPQAYNDGQWHHVVATQSAGGQQMFVDGTQVATGAAVTPQKYSGYWRLGTDQTWASSSSDSFAGSLDEAAVYRTVLPATAIKQHWTIGRPVPPNESPTAAFSSTVTKLKVAFDAAESTDADGSVESYAWDFGNGETGNGVSPNHTYAAAGTYTVALTVKDDQGATDLVSKDVVVIANEAPTAAFSSECTDLDCSFDAGAAADADGEVASYAWDLGDGTSGTGVTAEHSYASAGSYDVVLTVTDDDGRTNEISQPVTVTARNNPPTAVITADCTDLDCSFDGSGSTDPDGGVESYAWDFGDGGSGSAEQGTHSYEEPGDYPVVLTVTDDQGATGSASVVVTVVAPNQPPTAGFAADCTDLTCTFNAARASDPDGSVIEYAWDFGDGETGSSVTPTHTYAAGTFTVTLTVTDDDGATDTATEEVTAVEPNRPPVAQFSTAVTDLTVVADAADSTDVDGEITSYQWDFGDNTSKAGVSAEHRYAAAGDYLVTLTVTDDDGATDTVTATVTATYPIVAADTFTRSESSGLGIAEKGGAWTVSGPSVWTAVAEGSAWIAVSPARTNAFKLNSVSSLDTDLVHTVWLEQNPSGGGATLWTIVRSTSGGDYRLKLRIAPGGAMNAQLVRLIGSTETGLDAAVGVPGPSYTPNHRLKVRVQAFGSSPTTVRAKVWPAAETEPAAWATTGTDSAAALQQPGSIGLVSNLLGNWNNSIIRIDDLLAIERADTPEP